MKYFFPILFFIGTTCFAQQVIYVKKDAIGNSSGTSWSNAYTNLSLALKNAPAKAEIWIAKGTYTPISPDTTYKIVKGISLLGGFVGNETSKAARNAQSNLTILSGEGPTSADNDNFSIVLNIKSPTDSVILDGFVITRTQHKSYYTAALTAFNTKVRVENCVFENKMPVALGGSMIQADSGSLLLKNSNFMNNVTNYPTLLNVSFNSLRVENCLFENNSAQGFGLMNLDNTGLPIVFIGSTFRKNAFAEILINASYAKFQSCIFEDHLLASSYLLYVSGADSLVLENCDFLNNQTKDFLIYCNEATVRGCTFKNGGGNAIYHAGDTLWVQNSSFEGFTGSSGGAIFCNYGVFYNSTFTNNTSGLGGAIYSQNISLSNCTFLNNSAGTSIAGAVYTANYFNVDNCVFKNNVAAQGGGLVGNKGLISNSHFEDNAAWYSGGAVNSGDSTIIENSTFIHNGTPDTSSTGPSSSGGALYCGGHASIFNSFFKGNSAFNGAAVQAGGPSTFVNVTFLDNKSPVDSSHGTFSHAEDIQLVNCVFWDSTERELYAAVYTDTPGKEFASNSIMKNGPVNNTVLFVNPLLDSNGIPLKGSPVINKGTITNLWKPSALDAAGSPRIVQGIIDMGALEYQQIVTSIGDDADIPGLSIYPNPVSSTSSLKIEMEDLDGFSEAGLYNLMGAKVANFPMQENSTQISCAVFKPGNYVLVLSKKNGETAYKKIIVY